MTEPVGIFRKKIFIFPFKSKHSKLNLRWYITIAWKMGIQLTNVKITELERALQKCSTLENTYYLLQDTAQKIHLQQIVFLFCKKWINNLVKGLQSMQEKKKKKKYGPSFFPPSLLSPDFSPTFFLSLSRAKMLTTKARLFFCFFFFFFIIWHFLYSLPLLCIFSCAHLTKHFHAFVALS